MVNTDHTRFDFSGILPIEPIDIKTTHDSSGWLTDTTIRQILIHYGNHSASSRIAIVDPTWLATYERDFGDADSIAPVPSFLIERTLGGNRPVGLAMPFNEGNGHWTSIYVNLEARGAVYFDSYPGNTTRAEIVMQRFFAEYELFFQGQLGAPFTFHVDTMCARQSDVSSCGIYTCRNILDLLDHRRPEFAVLTDVQLKSFRQNATALLEAKMGGRHVPVLTRQQESRWGGPKSPVNFGAWPCNMYDGNTDFGKTDDSCGQEANKSWNPFDNFFTSGSYGFV
ncbi:uncharacterized protein PAC_02336 [Phialocephala subalpina]|uniref:Ubiquitin-like protease family profile domain-containing protein n=1 Tax=Phialocephala subalpina TaxID=576137 RepID=A0A1L7WI63_9HELO|nr:uncharacterized protein PAC_02336 [Phialocephala subalpina]